VHAEVGEYDRSRQVLDNITPGLATSLYGLYLDCLEQERLDPAAISAVIRVPDGKVDGHVMANTRNLFEAVEAQRCSVPDVAMQGLLEHLLTLPVRHRLDREALRRLMPG
jgi:hypothetical protein